jgi:hypothetical protein
MRLRAAIAAATAALIFATPVFALTIEEKETLRLQLVRPLVQGGFEDADGVFDAALTHLGVSDISKADAGWLKAEIAAQFGEKKRLAATWPERTDWDKIKFIFDRLDDGGIIALHNAGVTQSDGLSDVTEIWDERGGAASDSTGYVFYTQQDVEGVLTDGVLNLAFGATQNSPVDPMRIAKRIVDAFNAAGFKAKLPADRTERIAVSGIDWKKRSP